MAQPTAQELLVIALINRARLDPAGEAARMGIDLNEGLPPGTISATSKQPLAYSDQLHTSALGHSQSMITHDYFAHNDPTDGSTPFSRITATGYSSSAAGENIAARGSSAPQNLTTEVTQEHTDLFVDSGVPGRGHRTNMLSDTFQQVGTGVASGVTHNVFGGTFNTVMLTEDFARPSSPTQFLTGIAYNDTDGNAFYSVGEGRSNITVHLGSGNLITGTAGGYSGSIGSGAQAISFSGGDLAASVSLTATISSGRNALIDLIGQSTVETSVSVTEVSGLTKIIGLGTIGLTLTGASGNDTIIGGLGGDTLQGGVGNDTLQGGRGKDTLDGGAGVDTALYSDKTTAVVVTLNGATNATVMVGGTAEDTIRNIENVTGGSGNDTLIGDGLTNALIGGAGNDTLNGGSGNDTLTGGLGADTLDGGAGADTALYTDKTTAVVVTLNGATNATVTIGGAAEDTLRNIENVTGGSAGDTLTGDGLKNVLVGGAGNDVLSGGLGNDRLTGGLGTDTLDGGAGVDTALYTDKTTAVVVTLNGATDATVKVGGLAEDTIRNIENVTGGSAGDTLTGDASNNALVGGAGNDTLNGGTGNDTLTGGLDKDTLDGGTGVDTALYTDKTTAVVVTLNGATNATVTIDGVAEDTIRNIENVTGGSGNDTLTGDGLNNVLVGGDGNDTLKGGAGNDTLEGGLGADTLSGEAGADTFKFTAVTDSTHAAHDTILVFSGGNTAGHDSIAFENSLGLTTFDGQAAGTSISGGHVAWKESAGETIVYANTSASAENLGATNIEIHLSGTGLGLVTGDFLLHA